MLPELPTRDGHKAGTEPLETTVVFVAGMLVYLAFQAEFGIQGQHREAIRLHVAVATAFTYFRIDENAHIRVG